MVRRRWVVAAVVLVLVFGVGAAIALLLPPVYRSTATILIEQQEIPQDLVRSTITSFADQRIQLINQRVMITSNLLEIIRQHGLYADDIDRKPREVVIERMRRDIHMDMISADVVDPRSGSPTRATIAFTVGYDNRNPQLAVRVANELTSLYLQENSQSRRQQAAEASSFLADETKRLSDEISALEGRIAEFKQTNADRLPELTQLNMQLLTRVEQDLADVQRDRQVIEERVVYIDAELVQLSPTRDVVSSNGNVVMSPEDRLKSLQAYLASVQGVYTADHPDVVRTEKRIAALRAELGVKEDPTADIEQELATLRAQRSALLERYNELHPDVVRLDRQIAAATEKLAAAGTPPEPAAQAPVATNPLYIQIQAQRANDMVELKSLEQKEGELRARLTDLENRLLQTPGVERDYFALTRDLDNARAKYREVSAKQMEAVVAENLEIDAKAERFSLIEPPLLPQRPIAPNRRMVLLLGFVLALGAAGASIVLREALDGSIHGARELQRLTRAAPLGIIPAISTPDDRKAAGKRRRSFALATAGAFIALVVLAHLFVAPVDALWFAALRRLGV